jgi:hypothetical protein
MVVVAATAVVASTTRSSASALLLAFLFLPPINENTRAVAEQDVLITRDASIHGVPAAV